MNDKTRAMGADLAGAIERDVIRDGFRVVAVYENGCVIAMINRVSPMGEAHLLSISLYANAVPAKAVKVIQAALDACPLR